MKFKVLSLFPEAFASYFEASILKRALENSLITIQWINIRDYSNNKHNKVDDAPYGGGPGMVLSVEPVHKAIIENLESYDRVLIMEPSGTLLNQYHVERIKTFESIMLVCGHYEGFDSRIFTLLEQKNIPFECISIGDYILTGGELPAMIIMDAVARYVPGVIDNGDATLEESFSDHLLEYEQYTRPQTFEGISIPEILLSGHHKNIQEYRHQRRLERTKQFRPDLYIQYLKENQNKTNH